MRAQVIDHDRDDLSGGTPGQQAGVRDHMVAVHGEAGAAGWFTLAALHGFHGHLHDQAPGQTGDFETIHTEVPPGVRETITVGPFNVFFTNVNQAMGLRAHSHFAQVSVEYDTIAPHGFPAFEQTNRALADRVRELTERVFKDATNEDVARRLWFHLDGWRSEAWEQWGGDYALRALHLDVRGVIDPIGHDDGFTRYTIRKA